jgi:hypothetical protein
MSKQVVEVARAAAVVVGRVETATRTLQVIKTDGSMAYLTYPSDRVMTEQLAIRADVAEIVRVL